MNLKEENVSSSFKGWCNDCNNLSKCLNEKGYVQDDKFIMSIKRTFLTWGQIVKKKLLIKTIIVHSINEIMASTDLLEGFYPFLASYITKLTPFPNTNLTLIDLWSYSYGVDMFENEKPGFYEYLDLTAIEALNDCSLKKNEKSCSLAKSISERVWKNQDI